MCSTDPRRLVLLVAVPLLFSGCIETALLDHMGQPDDEPWPEAPASEPTDGAVWRGSAPSGSFLFFDQKARGVGDLVTVSIEEDISAEGQASTDLEKRSGLTAGITSDIGFQQMISSPFRLLFSLLGIRDPRNAGPSGTPLNVIDSEVEDTFEGEGTTRRAGTFDAIVTCRVVEELPGKIFKIRGRRALIINHEMQYLTVEGYVRQQDIQIDNVVGSAVLADARITLDGLGVIDDKQRPGWMSRILSWVYPF